MGVADTEVLNCSDLLSQVRPLLQNGLGLLEVLVYLTGSMGRVVFVTPCGMTRLIASWHIDVKHKQ